MLRVAVAHWTARSIGRNHEGGPNVSARPHAGKQADRPLALWDAALAQSDTGVRAAGVSKPQGSYETAPGTGTARSRAPESAEDAPHRARPIHLDGHVHVYPEFDLERLRTTALRRSQALGGPLLLMLSETDRDHCFEQLASNASVGSMRTDADSGPASSREHTAAPEDAPSGWLTTQEAESLRCAGPEAREPVCLIAGRQLVSREGLEILGLAWRPSRAELAPGQALATGQPASVLLRGLLAAGAIAVLPWGVGKWLGPRGQLVERLVRDPELAGHPRFLVGDIAHRCWPWPTPGAFRCGLPVLAGTDLLPLAGLEGQLAAYGSSLEASLDPDRPAESLRRALDARVPLRHEGRRSSPLAMLREQLQYRRAKASSASG